MINRDIYVMIVRTEGMHENVYWVIVACALLILVLVAVLFWLRLIKRWQAAADDEVRGMFTLQDLREMRQRGDISEAEYNKLRAKVLRSFGRQAGGVDTADPVVWEAEGEDGEVVWEADREEDGGWPDTEDDNEPQR